MTRTIFLIIGITGTALAVAVPSALGRPLPVSAIHDHGNATQAKLLVQSSTIGSVRDNGDATHAKLLVQSSTIGTVRDNGDAAQAKLLVQSSTIGSVRDNGDATQAKLVRLSGPVVVREDSLRLEGRSDPLVVRDHGDAEQAMLDAPSSGPSVARVEPNTGSELDWSQLAIGFGVGIVLATVLGLSLKATRPRTLVH
jgi:hypothetical protein